MDAMYAKYITEDNGSKVLYVQVIKDIYGLLVSAMPFYKMLIGNLLEYGFELNPYNPCVAKKGKWQTTHYLLACQLP